MTARALFLALALVLLPDSIQARTKVTRERAEITALKLVPGGEIVIGDLERNRNRLVWSFDVTIPGSRNVKAILIDARTGAVVSNTLEAPEDR